MSSDDCGECTWAQIAVNAAKATVNAAKHMAEKGYVLVDDSIKQARLSICEGCEFKDSLRCKACGCFIDAKVSLASETCPKGKWI